MKKEARNKVIIIAVLISLTLLFIACFTCIGGGIIFAFNSEYSHFKQVEDDALSIAGIIGTGNNYFRIDSKSSEVPFSEMTNSQMRMHLQSQEKAINAIKHVNTEFGFDDSLYTEMSQTTALMGTQREENDRYIVTWTYSYDDGLEVKYQIKTSAMFKIGGF